MAGGQGWLIEIAAVKDHLVAQRLRQQIKVRGAENLPFRHDGQAVCALHRGQRAIDQLQVCALTINAAGLFHGHRVIGLHLGACGPQGFKQIAAGCLAHIVGVGLEGQTPYRNGLALQLAVVEGVDAIEQHIALGGIAVLHSIEQQRIKLHFLGRVD